MRYIDVILDRFEEKLAFRLEQGRLWCWWERTTNGAFDEFNCPLL